MVSNRLNAKHILQSIFKKYLIQGLTTAASDPSHPLSHPLVPSLFQMLLFPQALTRVSLSPLIPTSTPPRADPVHSWFPSPPWHAQGEYPVSTRGHGSATSSPPSRPRSFMLLQPSRALGLLHLLSQPQALPGRLIWSPGVPSLSVLRTLLAYFRPRSLWGPIPSLDPFPLPSSPFSGPRIPLPFFCSPKTFPVIPGLLYST
jgi:hypothetical protein